MTYEFHSHYPPEELPEIMKVWVQAANDEVDGNPYMWLKQRGNRIKITRQSVSSGKGAYTNVSATRRSVGVSAGVGMSKETYYANPFFGRCLPDGKGGSILRGKIGFLWWGWVMFAVIGIGLLLACAVEENWIFFAVVSGLLIYNLVRIIRSVEKVPGSQAILAFLEKYFSMAEQRGGE